jgi:tetratricopeptide (TPR) repeat protein
MTYLLGVGFFVWADNRAWADFFIVYGPWLVVLPGALLVAHLYLRTHLGAWYLDRGRAEEALAYTSKRLDHSLMRGRKETLFHRLYRGRAQIAQMDYAEALNTLTRGFAMPDSESMEARFRRWQMEAALRLEDSEMLHEAWSATEKLDVGGSLRAALEACGCEWAAISGDREAFQRHLEEARWVGDAVRRVDFAEAVGAARLAKTDPDGEAGLDLLEQARESVQRQVPGRAGEICAMRAEFLSVLGRNEQAWRALERADQVPGDGRSRRALERVSNEMNHRESREEDER